MNTIQVGDRSQVFSTSFMVVDNTEVKICTSIGTTLVSISLTFYPPPEGGGQNAEWRFEKGEIKISFRGFNNPLGQCTTNTQKLGVIDGKPFGLQMINYHISGNNLVHFFLLTGGLYE